MTSPLEREAILPRIDGIRKNLKKLSLLAALPLEQFEGDSFDLAQHHLRLALEGIFHIASHILSRLPGERAVEYREIARNLGRAKVVPHDFAEKKLVPMAGMRNLLVHAYSDITPKRLLDVIKNHRGDIEQFLKHIKALVENPGKFGLTIS